MAAGSGRFRASGRSAPVIGRGTPFVSTPHTPLLMRARIFSSFLSFSLPGAGAYPLPLICVALAASRSGGSGTVCVSSTHIELAIHASDGFSGSCEPPISDKRGFCFFFFFWAASAFCWLLSEEKRPPSIALAARSPVVS